MTILDLLNQRGIQPKRASSSKGGEYASSCPGCGGEDRFRCWPQQGDGGSWWCRGCGKGGDMIQFLRDFDGLGYGEACRRLGKQQVPVDHCRGPIMRKQQFEAFRPEHAAEPPASWQTKAAQLVDRAAARLLDNEAQLAWLAERGVSRQAAIDQHLGWIPKDFWVSRTKWGLEDEFKDDGSKKKLWIPQGLLIPLIEGGRVLRVRIRRPEGDLRYYCLPGSSRRPLIVRPGSRSFVVVEAELDALAVASASPVFAGAYAVGNSTAKPDAKAHLLLEQAACILVALDYDDPDHNGHRPGSRASRWWLETYKQAERWPVPVGKDPGEAVKAGVSLKDWVAAGLTLP